MKSSMESVIMSLSTLGRSGGPVCNVKTAGGTNHMSILYNAHIITTLFNNDE